MIISPRRWGKSSLVERVTDLIRAEQPKGRIARIEMLTVNSEEGLLEEVGGGVEPGCLRREGRQDSRDSRGLPSYQRTRDSEYVAGGIGADGQGPFRPGPRSSERGGLAVYFYR